MDHSVSPLPIDLTRHPSPPPRRRRRHPKWKSGRFYLFLMFLWFRAVDVFALTYVYPKLSLTQKPPVLGWILITAIWTTVLLVVIACRQRWASYLLSASLIIAVLVNLAGIPALPDMPHPKRDFLFILEFTLAYFPVAIILMASGQIKKLTAQSLKISGDKPRDWPA